MSTGQPCLGHEVIVERPDGSRIRIAPFPHALYDTAGQVAGAINLLLPVAPQALSESEHMSVGRSAERLSHFLLPLADLARSIAGARHIEEAATETLELLCQTLNGALGTFWILDGKLRLRPIVCVESKPRAGRCSAFQRHTRQALLTWGSDLPGKAAASWKAVWVDNVTTDQEFRRSQLAAENGLASALAYPLIPTEGGPVRGVLELFFDEASPDHDWVHELMSGVSTLLSDFIAQQDMQRIERENRRRIQIETPGFVSAMFGRGGAMPTAASLHRRH